MRRTMIGVWLALGLAVLVAPVAVAQTTEQESEIAGVSTRVAFLRQYGGALHLGVVFHDTTARAVRGSAALPLSGVTVIDPVSGKKSFPLRDADGHYVAGPVSDWNGGGRWYPVIEGQGEVLVWAVFEPVTAGELDVVVPQSQPFSSVPVTTEPPGPGAEVGAAQGQLRATLLEALRHSGQLRVRIKVANPGRNVANGPAMQFADAYVLDPASRKKYGLMKDADGHFLAQPVSDTNGGGRLFLSTVRPGGQTFLNLTFTAPPDSVQAVDVVVPWLDPFEHVMLAGGGGGADSGAAVAGRTIGLERALQDLHADVTPERVKIDLAADVLFAFDRADLQPTAATALGEVATVIAGYPQARIAVDGYTDAKGSNAYNQDLSQRRAESVVAWLTAHGVAAAQLQARGHGEADPVAPNAKPDGSDDPDGRAKNRRVEITIIR